MATEEYERGLQETATWAVAVVCFVLLAISIFIEHIIEHIAKWLEKKHKHALHEALEKVKGELMLLGFISFLLTALQDPISDMCISREVADTWRPCAASSYDSKGKYVKSLKFSDSTHPRRSLAAKGPNKCGKGKVGFVSAYAIHQLHIFIFVLAIFHILQCIFTLLLGRYKMRMWKKWEDEAKSPDYQFSNDPQRFRFTRDTTFGRRHIHIWSKSSISLCIVSFFRQFYGSVTKVDYMALRHGFIMAHLAPGSGATFDFQKYIQRSLDEDFKVVVGISPIIWLFAVLVLLTNTYGWHPYYWIPFIPLIIILWVGAKLQMIITQMGLRIEARGEVVRGAPAAQPGDEFFWFGNPRFLLRLIHFVIFLNAFQLAFFAYTAYAFGRRSCFHKETRNIVIRLTTGVVIQVLCSYVTLPLYALVTQMGSKMRPTIFNERVGSALKKWHNTARKHVKACSKHSGTTNTPLSSAPATPTRGTSPLHLLHKHTGARSSDSVPTSPSKGGYEENERVRNWDVEEGAPYPTIGARELHMMMMPPASSTELPQGPAPMRIHQRDDIDHSTEFSFKNSHKARDHPAY
ncbi:MLO-like protein 2 isoform X1 [Neltuma alba]|uniref:MLO-like protein 2 isoform X1 n=1 Tax=Neltuma alba TaxID=207710 RepID=UPI0010A3E20F|nr:MLO-like protein 2 isoform X1 [Prosopis alba]